MTLRRHLAVAVIAAAALLAPSAAVAAGTGPAHPARPSYLAAAPWRATDAIKLGKSGWFTDVEATSRDDAWAVGDVYQATVAVGGFVTRWNGSRWQRVALPIGGFVPVSVSASKGSSVWVFGYQDNPADGYPADALTWSAGQWRVIPLPAQGATWIVLGDLQSVVLSDDDVWVTGNAENSTGTTGGNVMWNWNGSHWIRYRLRTEGVRGISGSSPDNVWAITQGSHGVSTALRWNGVSWRVMRIPFIESVSVVAQGADHAWIAGAGRAFGSAKVLYGTARRWSAIPTPPVPAPFNPAASDGHGGLWFNMFEHYTGGQWYSAVPPVPAWHGCGFGLGAGVVAAIPGTSAAWLADGCSKTPTGRVTPVIAIEGRL
jgi:hypothetical protein